jgi:Cellulase (glycosyl hydrolase family 5).
MPAPLRQPRRSLLPCAAFLAALAAAPLSHAAILAHDDFESYDVGAALDGLDGGSGWSAPWRGVAGVTISDEPVTLDGLGGGKSLKITAHHDNALGRAFLPELDTSGADYFVSFLFRIVGPTPGATFSGNVFTGWQAEDATPDINVDNIGYVGGTGYAGARVNGNSSAVNTALRYGQTYRFVIKYTGWSGGRYRKTQVWLNPAPNDENSTNTAVTRSIDTTTGGSAGILGLLVRGYGLNSNTYQLVDELRVGQTWGDVVPGGTFTVTAGPDWTPLAHSLDIVPGGVFDFSRQAGLDAPAGKHGHLVATPEGRFEFENRPGQRVRFWGVNLTYEALFLSKSQADKLAERLARSGYNTVRIHHFDRDLVGTSFSNPSKRSWHFDATKLDQLDYLFAALKQRGIYINIDLFSDRRFSSAEANAVGTTAANLYSHFKAFVRINDAAFDSWKNFAEALLNHVNPYTGMTWGADPALIGICPVNEDPTQEVYDDQPALFHARFEQLHPQWIGVPKTDAGRTLAFNRFIFESNIEFDARCRAFLRDALQTKALITGANFTISQGLTFVRSHYDYVDNHIYQDHPSGWSLPITFEQTSSTGSRAYVPTRMAPTRIFGRPFTSTEFHFSRPNQYRAEGVLLMPAYASLQDWDGMYNFHYATTLASVTNGSADNYFSLANDPVGLVGDRLGSLLFQREDIAPAERALVYAVREAEAYSGAYNAAKDTYARKEFAGDFRTVGLVARIGSLPGDPASVLADNPQFGLSAAVIGSSPALNPLPAKTFVSNSSLLTTLKNNGILPSYSVPSTTRLVSDTKELELDSVARTFRALTDRGEHFLLPPSSQLAGKQVASVANLSDIPAVVSLLALKTGDEIESGAPVPTLATARRILVTHLTDALTTGMRFANADRKVLQNWGSLPHLVRRGEAALTVRLPAGDWRAWTVDITGARVAEHPLTRTAEPDTWQMTLSTVGPAGARLAYELEFVPPPEPEPPSPYEAWRAAHFSPAELDAPAISGPTSDPDGDGLPNLLEYALGGDPTDATSTPSVTIQIAPLESQPTASALSLTFHRIADPALVYRVQASEDLASPTSWGDIWLSFGADNIAGPVTVVDEVPLASRPRRFLRLHVSLAETPEPLAGETREAQFWPYSADSLWNTPVGAAVRRGGSDHPLAKKLNTHVGQLNWSTFSTPVNIAGAEGAELKIHQVAAGRWSPRIGDEIKVPRAPANILLAGDMLNSAITYNDGGGISFTNTPDGFMALIDTVTMTAVEAYKTCWTKGGNTTTNRVLVAREGTVKTFDLRGDGWSVRGARASGLTFLGGLIRKKELEKASTDPKNAIRHALALAINNAQLLNPNQDTSYPTPGYQWPARGHDGDGPANYSGLVRMGTHFVLHPDFDIERPGLLTDEGKALAYALRDYGAYVADRSTYVSLYAERQVDPTAAAKVKTAWQTVLLKHMVPVLNNSADAVGGPGARVRPPAPDFVAI